MWTCECCGKDANAKNTAIDHINPVVDPNSSYAEMNLDEIAASMWNMQYDNPLDNLQLLCKTCHDSKSAAENELRRKIKREKEMSRKATTAAKELPDSVDKEALLQLFEDLGDDIVHKLTGAQLGEFIDKTVKWYRGRKK